MGSSAWTDVAGVDEVGRGPLAGPVVTAAVILDPHDMPSGLADSKILSAARREIIFADIASRALAISVTSAGAVQIDLSDIRRATLLAMARAVAGLSIRPARVLVDGRDRIACAEPCEAIVRGDATVPAIAAASIVAKVTRDRLMARLDRLYPGYGFAIHAGYGTAQHRAAIDALGPCPHHRFSFAPVKGRWRR